MLMPGRSLLRKVSAQLMTAIDKMLMNWPDNDDGGKKSMKLWLKFDIPLWMIDECLGALVCEILSLFLSA